MTEPPPRFAASAWTKKRRGGRIVVCFASDGSVGEDWDFEMGEREGCLGVVGMGEIC